MNALTQILNRDELALRDAFRGACTDLATRVITRTPVDEGVLRSAWTPAINALDNSNSGGDVFAVAARLQLGESFSLVNAQPYARPIEYLGHSGQAPQGMLRISVAEWPSIVAQAVARAAS